MDWALYRCFILYYLLYRSAFREMKYLFILGKFVNRPHLEMGHTNSLTWIFDILRFYSVCVCVCIYVCVCVCVCVITAGTRMKTNVTERYNKQRGSLIHVLYFKAKAMVERLRNTVLDIHRCRCVRALVCVRACVRVFYVSTNDR